MNNATWIDAKVNPPKESGTYYILTEYIDDGKKELVPDIGLYHKWTEKSRCAHSFWQAHPYINKGFLPIDDDKVVYYMDVPEIPHDQVFDTAEQETTNLNGCCEICKHFPYCNLSPYYCSNGDVWVRNEKNI